MPCRSREMIAFAVFMQVLCSVRSANSTTIVLVRTPSEIAIAADSAGTFRTGGNEPPQAGPVCQIYQKGSIFFAVANSVNSPTAPAIISEVLTPNRKLIENVQDAEQNLSYAILNQIPHLREIDPAFYDENIKNGNATTVLFATVENGEPVAIATGVHVAVPTEGEPQVSFEKLQCPGNDCPTGTMIMMTGEQKNIRARMASARPQNMKPAALAASLVQIEVDAGTPGVAGPIDVVSIDASGAHWIQHKDNCPIKY